MISLMGKLRSEAAATNTSSAKACPVKTTRKIRTTDILVMAVGLSMQTSYLVPSAFERWFNWLFGLLVGWGLGLPHNYLLQVQGRKTGKLYSTPVNVLDFKDKRFLVAPRGMTHWVRNATANGELWLKRGRSREQFSVRVLTDAEKPEILREYLNRYKTTVQRYFPIAAGSPLEEFSSVASSYPVFQLTRL
jgi:deazaflavin-dependent oxidoreductase (nitroreductase family)